MWSGLYAEYVEQSTYGKELPGQVVLALANLHRLRVETTDLSERDVDRVAAGQRATVYVEALALASCAPAPTPTQPAGGEEAAAPTAPAETEKQVEITWWFGWGSDLAMEVLPSLADRFMELNPNITVESDTYGFEDAKILTAIAGGDPPDLFNTAIWGDYAISGALRPADDFIDASPEIAALYYPASWEMCTLNGKRWGIMGLEHFVVLGQMANVDLWEERGLKIPDDLPETWWDAIELAKEYTELDDAGNVTLLWASLS